MRDSFGRVLYSLVDCASGLHVSRSLDQLEETQFWEPARLRALQRARLSAVLQHAYANVPFYFKRFQSQSIDVSSLKDPFEVLQNLPSLTKQEILDAGATILDPDPKERFRWDSTSGSTGTPLRFRKNLAAAGYQRANHLRLLSWYGVRAGDRQARFWGQPIGRRDRELEKVRDHLLNRRTYSSFTVDDEDLDRALRRMAAERTSFLYGYPSVIQMAAKRLLGKSLGNWRPKLVVTTAERLFPDQREEIARAFQSPVADEYGASEVTMIAASCPRGSLHLSEETVYTEFEPTEVIVDGARVYKLIFTDLTNVSMPLIRYETGDLARLNDEPCSCKRTLRRIESLIGREGDILIARDGRKVHGSFFGYAGKSILSMGGVRRFRARQVRIGLVVVQFERTRDFNPHCLYELTREIQKRAGDDCEVLFEEVSELQPEGSGKLRYFYSEIASRRAVINRAGVTD